MTREEERRLLKCISVLADVLGAERPYEHHEAVSKVGRAITILGGTLAEEARYAATGHEPPPRPVVKSKPKPRPAEPVVTRQAPEVATATAERMAERYDKIVAAVRARGSATIRELERDTGIGEAMVRNALVVLTEDGEGKRIELVGKRDTGGRMPANVYGLFVKAKVETPPYEQTQQIDMPAVPDEPEQVIDVPVIRKDPRLDNAGDDKTHGTKGEVTVPSSAEVAAKLGTFSRAEFAEEVGLRPIGASRWLGALQELGIIESREGAFHYVPFDGVMPEVKEPTPEPEPEPDPQDADEQKLTPGEVKALGMVRDFAVKQTDVFGPKDVQKATELPREAVMACLDDLVRQSIIKDESVGPDMPLYAYVKPTDPGKGAILDMERRKAESATGGDDFGGSGAVAGTGKQVKANNPDVNALLQAARKAGCDTTHAANGHFEIKTPGGKRVLIAATPKRGGRTVMNDKVRVRKALTAEGLAF